MADSNSRAGARYASPEIVSYVERTHAGHDVSLQRAFAAPERHGLPAIQLAASEGKTLTLLMQLMRAEKVVEVGTLAGYSALRLVRGLAPSGKLWTCELDPKHAQVARDNFVAAGVADRIEILEGPALQRLADIAGYAPFDAVFIDADKSGYPDYARWAHSHLRPGGLLVGDNAYFFGELLADKADAARMREFHEFVAQHFESVCVPTPDGLVLALAR